MNWFGVRLKLNFLSTENFLFTLFLHLKSFKKWDQQTIVWVQVLVYLVWNCQYCWDRPGNLKQDVHHRHTSDRSQSGSHSYLPDTPSLCGPVGRTWVCTVLIGTFWVLYSTCRPMRWYKLALFRMKLYQLIWVSSSSIHLNSDLLWLMW
jgi:hypothetical protein